MRIGGTKATLMLLAGDLAVFILSLWLALVVRVGGLPPDFVFYNVFAPFCVLFALWVLVFYIAGLYSKSTILFHSRMVGAIFNTQITNIVLAALFFFFIPYFGVTPKTILAIYLVLSLGLIFFWRLFLFPRLTMPAVREKVALIGVGIETEELVSEINGNPRYPLRIESHTDPATLSASAFEQYVDDLDRGGVTMLVVNMEHAALRELQPRLYELVFVERRLRIVDFNELYEEVFDRVPLSLLNYEWFLSNLTHLVSNFYLALKRLVDIVGAIAMAAVTITAIPFVWIAMQIEDGGPLFLVQERIGMHGVRMRVYKFRSMSRNDAASASWVGEGQAQKNHVTRVGSLLRLTSLDEFPQCINILAGQISLVGPRNDIVGLGVRLAQAIPYYNLRYTVKPGITGWAQINQRYEPGNISPQSIDETKVRLAYDFYYIKNRSLALDFMIMLRTLKRMFFRISSI